MKSLMMPEMMIDLDGTVRSVVAYGCFGGLVLLVRDSVVRGDGFAEQGDNLVWFGDGLVLAADWMQMPY